MKPDRQRLRWWLIPTLTLAIGSTAGAATIALASTGAERAQAPAVFDATHLPPLLTTAGESVDLEYDTHCAPPDEDVEPVCDVRGSVFVRAAGERSFEEHALVPRSVDGRDQLAFTVPASLAGRSGGFEYYAALESSIAGERLVVPAGGSEAPQASRPLENEVDISLGRHEFGRGRRAGTRLAFARWGDGPADVGLEPGRNLGPIGASAFDVDNSGSVLVLDQVHRRLLRWRKGADTPVRIPVSVAGTLADLATDPDGAIYVLESAARDGRRAQVRRFDDDGRELEVIETAERTSSQIRMSPDGPVVLGQPSHQWLPVSVSGMPASRAEQLERGRSGRPFRDGVETIALRRGNELLVALTAGRRISRSWRLTSDTPLAEVQLAEPLGSQRLAVVVRAYDERSDEFVVLVLDRHGIVDRFALDPADWAESSPFGRFRLVGKFLHRLGSTSAGAFVDRYQLEVR
jgi:hypothetical protein